MYLIGTKALIDWRTLFCNSRLQGKGSTFLSLRHRVLGRHSNPRPPALQARALPTVLSQVLFSLKGKGPLPLSKYKHFISIARETNTS